MWKCAIVLTDSPLSRIPAGRNKMQVLWPNFKRTIDGIPGLAVVVVQDATTLEILMQAFSDETGWEQTLKSGRVSLFSTSRKKSWIKGEESGNFMEVKNIRLDCDGDTIVYLVEPQGKGLACHTGARTCFYRSILRNGLICLAPQAGADEALELREFEVHPDLTV